MKSTFERFEVKDPTAKSERSPFHKFTPLTGTRSSFSGTECTKIDQGPGTVQHTWGLEFVKYQEPQPEFGGLMLLLDNLLADNDDGITKYGLDISYRSKEEALGQI